MDIVSLWRERINVSITLALRNQLTGIDSGAAPIIGSRALAIKAELIHGLLSADSRINFLNSE
jgi:hypothetical protein